LQSSDRAYLEQFKGLLEVYQHHARDVGGQQSLEVDRSIDRPDDIGLQRTYLRNLGEEQNKGKSKYIATRFLTRSDPIHYGSLLAEIENAHTRGQDSYPTSLTMAYDMLVDYIDPEYSKLHGYTRGMIFYHKRKPPRRGHSHARREWLNSNGGRGHISNSSHFASHPDNMTDEVEPTNANS
jgi:hypothetical protein